MSFAFPTLQDLLDKTRKSFRSNMPGSDAYIWPNNVTVSAKVIAGAIFEAFGWLSYTSKKIFAHTAPDLETLILHGTEFDVPLRPAAPAAGKARLTTTGDCFVSASAVLRRADGIQYLATASASRVGAGTLDFAVIAEADGLTTNALDGTPLEIVSGVTGDATAAVLGDIIGGLDVEDKETYRQRILFRKRNPPHGGSPSDYVMWAERVSGVSRVFVERHWAGGGTIRVFILMDGLYDDGIPSDADIARVRDYLETVQPAAAIVTVAAPTAHPINVTISDVSPDTVPVREAIVAELRDMFQRRSRASGADIVVGGMPYLATPATFSLSWIDQAISEADGEDSHELTSPVASEVIPAGSIATLGAVTFV